MTDLTSFRHVAVRAWTQRTPGKGKRSTRRHRPAPPIDHVLVIDTETTVDSAQALLFGVFRYCRVDATTVTTVAEGLTAADDLPERDPNGYARLQAYAVSHKADVDLTYLGVEPNWDLALLSRTEFAKRWLWHVGYPHNNRLDPATIVMFNAPFDFSRLAVDAAEARGDMYGGFSLTLWSDTDGQAAPWRPRVAIKSLDFKRAIKKFRRLELAPAGEHGEQATHGRQRIVQRAGGHPSPGQRDPRPAQPRGVLRTQHQIQAAAQRVAVDQQSPPTGFGGGDGHRSGQHRRPGTTATPENGQHPAAVVGPLHPLPQGRHQKPLALGQRYDVLGANGDCATPEFVAIGVRTQYQDPLPAGQPGRGAPGHRARVQQYQRSSRPGHPGPGDVDGQLEVAPGGGGQPQQFLMQRGVGDERENPAGSGIRTGHGMLRRLR